MNTTNIDIKLCYIVSNYLVVKYFLYFIIGIMAVYGSMHDLCMISLNLQYIMRKNMSIKTALYKYK